MSDIPELSQGDQTMLVKVIKKAFSIYDADGSGSLDPEELEELLTMVCDCLGLPQLYQAQLQESIKILDADGDGDIDYKEIIRNLPKLNKILRDPELMINFEESEDDPDNPNYHRKNPNFVKGLGRRFTLMESLKQPDEKKDNQFNKNAKNELSTQDRNAIANSVLDMLNKSDQPDELVKIETLMNNLAKSGYSQSQTNGEKNGIQQLLADLKGGDQKNTIIEENNEEINDEEINEKSFSIKLPEDRFFKDNSISIIDGNSKCDSRKFTPTKKRVKIIGKGNESARKFVMEKADSLQKKDFLTNIRKGSSDSQFKINNATNSSHLRIRENIKKASLCSIDFQNDFINYIDEYKLKKDPENIQLYKQELEHYMQSYDKEQYFLNCGAKKIHTMIKNTKEEKTRLQNIIMNLDIILANGSKCIKKSQTLREELDGTDIYKYVSGVTGYFQVDIKKDESIDLQREKPGTKQELKMEKIKKKIIDDQCYTQIDKNFFSKNCFDEKYDFNKLMQSPTKSLNLPSVGKTTNMWYDFKTGKRVHKFDLNNGAQTSKLADSYAKNAHFFETNFANTSQVNNQHILTPNNQHLLTDSFKIGQRPKNLTVTNITKSMEFQNLKKKRDSIYEKDSPINLTQKNQSETFNKTSSFDTRNFKKNAINLQKLMMRDGRHMKVDRSDYVTPHTGWGQTVHNNTINN